MFISGYNRIPNHLNTLRVDSKIFVSAKKYLRKKKFPDTCGHGLKCVPHVQHVHAARLFSSFKQWDHCLLALLATEESMVRLITWTRQKLECQLEPWNYLLRSGTDSQFPNISELKVERRKLEVESRLESRLKLTTKLVKPVSQRIWTPRSKSASGFGPPFLDLDPPTKHSVFPIYSNSKLLGDVLKDFNTRSRTIIDEEKRI